MTRKDWGTKEVNFGYLEGDEGTNHRRACYCNDFQETSSFSYFLASPLYAHG